MGGVQKQALNRRSFTLEFKAEAVQHQKVENLIWAECGRKFEVLPKLVQQWERPYEAGELTAAAGRRAVSPEQAEITRLRAELSRSRMEVSILKKAAAYFAKDIAVKYAFIRAELGGYPLSIVCRLLGLSQAGYHAWVGKARSRRDTEREALRTHIQAVFDAQRGRYGAPRIERVLRAEYGYSGSLNRIQALMRAMGLRAKAGDRKSVV